MGLDMWLNDKDGNEIMYWRKANQIRGWFVGHDIIQDDDDCVKRLVTLQDLKDLIEDCKKVLEDHSLAEELLPPTYGFFFGADEIDEYYFEDLQSTVDKLEPIVQAADEHSHFIYSDWW